MFQINGLQVEHRDSIDKNEIRKEVFRNMSIHRRRNFWLLFTWELQMRLFCELIKLLTIFEVRSIILRDTAFVPSDFLGNRCRNIWLSFTWKWLTHFLSELRTFLTTSNLWSSIHCGIALKLSASYLLKIIKGNSHLSWHILQMSQGNLCWNIYHGIKIACCSLNICHEISD